MGYIDTHQHHYTYLPIQEARRLCDTLTDSVGATKKRTTGEFFVLPNNVFICRVSQTNSPWAVSLAAYCLKPVKPTLNIFAFSVLHAFFKIKTWNFGEEKRKLCSDPYLYICLYVSMFLL